MVCFFFFVRGRGLFSFGWVFGAFILEDFFEGDGTCSFFHPFSASGKRTIFTDPFDHCVEQGKTLTLGIFDQELGMQSFSSPQHVAKGVASNHTHHPGEHPKG